MTRLLLIAMTAASASFLITVALGLIRQMRDERLDNPFVYRSPRRAMRDAVGLAAMLVLGTVTLALLILDGLK